MSSNKCFPLSPTWYPEFSARRVPMQPEHHSPWLLLGVCTYLVYMTLLCCEISLIHWPLHVMWLMCVQDHSPRLILMPPIMWRCAICHSTTLACFNSLISRSCDFHLSYLVILAFHIHIIILMQVSCQSLKPISRNSHHCHANLVPSFNQ
jgi:hypothetical protein